MPKASPVILMVQRAARFSPDAEEKDLAILRAVGDSLEAHGARVDYVKEELLENGRFEIDGRVEAIFSMARSEAALGVLQRAEAKGVTVINAVGGVATCNSRRAVDALMRGNGIPAAPLYEEGEAWVKADRGHDVFFAPDASRVQALAGELEQPLVTAHVVGETVKFYGVAGRFFSPDDRPALQEAAERLAQLAGVQVYGGDAVVRSDGTFAIIDFNDWPSFSRCREAAAHAIESLYEQR